MSEVRLRSTQEVHRYIERTCFKTGPPRQVGIELEWHVLDAADAYAEVPIERVEACLQAAALPPGASRVTFEPGGQLELSSPPAALPTCVRGLAEDVAAVSLATSAAGLLLLGLGTDPARPARRQLNMPRYAAMEEFFDHASSAGAGRSMMCSTAAVQVNLDAGESAQLADRWDLAHAIGPVLVAMFANSPLLHGRPTGWKSTRQAIWSQLDPSRTRAPQAGHPTERFAEYALDAEVMLVRRSDCWISRPGLRLRDWLTSDTFGPPTEDDLDYHLSTLFPPVRPRGWIELRMIDAQSDDEWQVVAAVTTALMDDPGAAAIARMACDGVRDRWTQAARVALDDPALARAARTCLEAAQDALPRLGAAELVAPVSAFAARYVERARCPADDVLEGSHHAVAAVG